MGSPVVPTATIVFPYRRHAPDTAAVEYGPGVCIPCPGQAIVERHTAASTQMERIVGIATGDEASVEGDDCIHAARCIVDVERGLVGRLLPSAAIVRPGYRAIVFVTDQDGLVPHGGDSDWSCIGDRR